MRLDGVPEQRGAHAPFEPLYDPSLLDQHERGHGLDPKAPGQIGALVDIDLQHPQVPTLLPGDARDQAVHSARRPRVHGEKEDE